MSAAIVSLFGWCQTHGSEDTYHDLCRGECRSQFGVMHRCGCVRHEWEEGA